MKYLVLILMVFLLVACNSDAPGIGSSKPEGAFATESGKSTLTFHAGRVRFENPVYGSGETSFEMVDGVAKFQFKNGFPMTLKKEKDGSWIDETGTKLVQK